MKEKHYRIGNKGIWEVTSYDSYESCYKTFKDAYYNFKNYYVSVDPYETDEEIELKRKAKVRNNKIDLILGE